MADTTSDDVYDDPDNILADTDDDVDGAVELPEELTANNPSQSIFKPELRGDDRGPIDELEGADEGDSHDEMSTRHPEDTDADSFHLGDVNPDMEQDGTES